jgi:hypothetical protein
MSERLCFDFHGLAGVEVIAPRAQAAFFAAEYAHHRVADLPEDCPRVRLLMEPRPRPAWTRHTHKLLARWSYAVDLDDDEITLRVSGSGPAVAMIHHMLVHPALRWLAARQGALMLHAGAVARGGGSVLFTGRGGAGKTTTVSLALALGRAWGLHADDYVFLRPGEPPHSLAYFTRSHLYLPLVRWLPALQARLTPAERRRLELFGRLRAWTHEGVKWPVRVEPERLWPGKPLVPVAEPRGLLVLDRGDAPDPTLEELPASDDLAESLIDMNFGEARHFLALLEKDDALDPGWLADWRARERELLDAILDAVDVYRLCIPPAPSGAPSPEAARTLAALIDAVGEGA